jgi:hypothetical protein
MPIGNPPDDDDGNPAPWPDPVTVSSTAAGGLPTLEALVDLVGAWDTAAKRFDTIKILRVMSLRLWNPLDRLTNLARMPEMYFDFYCDPRMSRAYAAAGLTKDGQREHLDFDWYGAPGETWWPTKNGNQRDGRKFKRRVVHRLLNYLEASIGLTPTVRGSSWTTWDWGGPKSTPWNDLKMAPVPTNGVLQPLEIRWTLATGANLLVNISGGVLKITSPWPADRTPINLS